MLKCVCTGFALVDEYGVWWPADLFKQDETFIANTSGGGISSSDTPPQYERQAMFHYGDSFFERRGVYVFSRGQLQMNEQMAAYIKAQL